MLRNSGRSGLSVSDDGGGDEDANAWIMSYADTVTLLLCFFIIFFAEQSKKADQDVLIELGRDMKKSQGDSAEDEGKNRMRAQMLSKIESEVRSELAQFEVKKVNLGINRRRKEILLRLYERDFFHIGSFNLKPNGYNVLEGVAELLKPYQDKILIKVEGHSDSLAVNPMSPYKTNLNLSSLRASQAANVLILNQLSESKIRVVGYGSARPLVNDRSPAGEGKFKYIPEKGLKNRRIEVRIQIADDEADGFVDLVL
ncbi:MAG: OmpA/MotB family protein [Bdellovibrionales bacterium]